MKKLTQEQIDKILEGHKHWLNEDCECWVAEPASAETEPPIAWCEIPKYKE
jgi:hypothetical protein